MVRPGTWHRIRGLLLTSSVATACTSMRVQTAPVPDPLPTGRKGEIRLSLRSGANGYLYDARIAGDSIVGFDRPSKDSQAERVAFLTADVTAVAVRKGDAFKTVIAVAAGTVAVFTFILLAACASLLSASST